MRYYSVGIRSGRGWREIGTFCSKESAIASLRMFYGPFRITDINGDTVWEM
jgi:hypothetical protein